MTDQPLLFQTKEGMDWMLRALAKADEVEADYEKKAAERRRKRKERYDDFMDFCHRVMEDARREEKISQNKLQ